MYIEYKFGHDMVDVDIQSYAHWRVRFVKAKRRHNISTTMPS